MYNDSRFPWGISLLLFGILFLLRQLGVFSDALNELIFDWRNIPLVLGVIFLLTYKNKSTAIILLILWGLLYLKDIILWSKNLSDFIWPALLILAGSLLVNSSMNKKRNEQNTNENDKKE
jgi:predicted membrane protein